MIRDVGTEYDVIVAGAGPAGSSAAKVLADRGWKTLCVDRRSFPRHKVCGEFMSPEARRTLQEMRLLDAVRELEPALIEQAVIVTGRRSAVKMPLPEPAYGISRFALDAALHEAAVRSGAKLLPGTIVTRVDREGEAYAVEMRRGKETANVRAKAVIAAWGNRSRIVNRENRGNLEAGNAYIGLKCHLTGIDPGSSVELYLMPGGGYIGIAPVERGIVNLAGLLPNGAEEGNDPSWSAGGTKAGEARTSAYAGTAAGRLLAAAMRHPVLAKRLRGASPVPQSDAAVYPVILDRRPRLWEDYPCIGDAGLMIPPLCGDGMSIAFYTAKICGDITHRYLSGDLDAEGWRREYERAASAAVNRPLYWGRLLHECSRFSRAAGPLASFFRSFPALARMLLRATRLDIR